MDELKPCPFCGGEAILGWDYKEEVYFIHCKKCRCTIYNGNEIRDEAVADWNRRYEDG